jgi:Zn-dependent protease with chaperone function
MSAALGAAVVLAAFFLTSAIVSAMVAAAAPAALAALAGVRPSLRGALVLGLRLLPSAAALFVAAGLVAPAYVLFEPPDSGERVGAVLAGLAFLGLLLLVLGLRRGTRALAATSALARRWGSRGGRVDLAGSPVRAYRVDQESPVFAVVGVRRPRLFVSTRVLEALTPAEVEAALAHERAHLAAHDNLKRLAMASAPDLLRLFPAFRALEGEWARAAEAMADARASAGDGGTALALAAGLVKVARLTARPAAGLPISALHDGGDVEARVRWLVNAADGEAAGSEAPARAHATGPALLLGLPIVAAVAILAAQALPAVHRLVEVAVRLAR